MKKLILLLITLYINSIAQDSLKFKMNEIVVTSLHHPKILFDINRSIEVLFYQRIESSPTNGVQDFLNYSNSVDLNQRGANGVQADATIRGGGYEQTLIMLDGIKIIDPQTGHHNLNLPITSLNVEQIEIVKGNSSNINGANAFSGLINFKTKRLKENTFAGEIIGGDHGLYSGSFFGSYNLGKLSNNFSIEQNHSDGYRENTEYDITNISYGGAFSTSSSVFDVFIGYTDKSFGANSFYTTRFPLQFEQTKTTFAKLSAEFGGDLLNYSTKIYWRKNEDEFLLNKNNPSFYKNNHATNLYGAEVGMFINSNLGRSSLNAEFIYDEISSNNLGEHNRNRFGFSIEHKLPRYKNVQIGISGFIHNYSQAGWKILPGFDLSYLASKNINLYANYSRGFRIPTYTELYYNDPITEGNKYLANEETSNYEIGLKYFDNFFSSSATLFSNTGSNIIDWVLISADAPWKATNIAKIKTTGLELNLNLNIEHWAKSQPIQSIEFKYTYLSSDYNTGDLESRYLLKYLKHQAIIILNHKIVFGIIANWYFRYEERYNSESNFITDLSIKKSINKFNIFVKATNLFNVNYFDFIGVPLPGRWISGGMKIKL